MATGRRTDAWAMAAIALAAVVVTWPLLAHLEGVPPRDWEFDHDILNLYGYAAAAHVTVFRFGQFPLRSPWHGGGYPIYAYPDDTILTPTMLLVLAAGPYAALKIGFVLTYVLAGIGMYLLTRRKMGYSLAAAVLSATSFAFGGFLMARLMRGWRTTTHAVWLPLILYALWRGRDRRRWLALAAALVAFLLLDHKYVPLVMGWFLVMVGLLGLDEEASDRAGPGWGFLGRLVVVWVFGAGLAAVKLVPMWPLLSAHLKAWRPEWYHNPWNSVALWLVIFAALGVMPLLVRWMRVRRRRLAGVGGLVGAVAAVVLAAILWAPHPVYYWGTPRQWLVHCLECVINFGAWAVTQAGERLPWASDRYWGRSPVGPFVFVLAIVALGAAALGAVPRLRRIAFFRRRPGTWKWAVLAALFVAIELSAVSAHDLGESVRGLPLLSWIRRTREQFNFYLFFVLTVLAGRAIDWRPPARWSGAWRGAAWGLVLLNAAYLGWNTQVRIKHTVKASPPPQEREWGPYELLDRAADRWRDHSCFLLRQNIGLKWWDLDFRDRRREALVPSLRVAPDGSYVGIPGRGSMVSFDQTDNEVRDWTFTPNEIVVHVRVEQPGLLVINQISDPDWRVNVGSVVRGVPFLAVRLTGTGEYAVRLRYVPTALFVGLAITLGTALAGAALLVRLGRRGRLRGPRSAGDGAARLLTAGRLGC